MQRVKFDEKELNVIGQNGMNPIFDTPVTPAENFVALFEGKKPLWMPMTSETKMFAPRLDPDNIARGFVFDGEGAYDKALYGGKDMFGIEWEFVPVVGGSMVRPGQPLMEDVNDWKEFVKLPDVNAWDWEGAAKANEAWFNHNYVTSFTLLNGFMFERLISFMEFEGAAMAIIDEDQIDAVKELLNEIVDKVYIPYIENIKKYFPKTQMLWSHDDWGSQRAPFFKTSTAMELFVPIMQKFAAKCKELGLIYQMHSCGANELLVPAYVAGGAQMWNGMSDINDKRKIFELYGDQIVLGVDLPAEAKNMEATDEELEAIAKEFCEFFIRNGECKTVANVSGCNPKIQKYIYKISREMLA